MKTIIKILLLASIVVGALYLLAPSDEVSAISPLSDCVKLTWHHNTICTVYTAGSSNISISGDAIPRDNSLDGKYFRLSGYLVDYNHCTVMVVKEAIVCSTPALPAFGANDK